jgi:hypothetical protein
LAGLCFKTRPQRPTAWEPLSPKVANDRPIWQGGSFPKSQDSYQSGTIDRIGREIVEAEAEKTGCLAEVNP